MSRVISVREAITSVVRVVKRDGFRGLAKRTKIHWADARDCRRFLQRVECDQPTGPKQAVEFAFSIAAIRPFQVKSEILVGTARFDSPASHDP